MSIDDKLAQLLGQGKLIERPSQSPFTRFDTGRIMIVTPEIDAITKEPFADTGQGDRLGELAAWLDNWSEYGLFTVSEDPDDKPPDTMLARVREVEAEFWSMRVSDPDDTPGIRVLGAFADKDVFVALAYHYREDMTFDDDVADVQEIWRDYFGSESPHSGSSLDDYLSNFREEK